ncbi:unnamed protein product [Meloidogyne enterolobii]|uniref:Uncharacterized protein n=1 Tax=Meloidogyne enterolobii TaxID=390850 RepID=A0ACB0ZL25_MELEN
MHLINLSQLLQSFISIKFSSLKLLAQILIPAVLSSNSFSLFSSLIWKLSSLGQFSFGPSSQTGPYHHCLFARNSNGVQPLVPMSAGLPSVGT